MTHQASTRAEGHPTSAWSWTDGVPHVGLKFSAEESSGATKYVDKWAVEIPKPHALQHGHSILVEKAFQVTISSYFGY